MDLRLYFLFWLRALTKRGYQIRGLARICDMIRRYYCRSPRIVWIEDFDKNLNIQVRLGEHIGSQMFWRGEYSGDQLDVMRKLLKHDDVFVDIGANIGIFSLVAAKLARAGRVYAFEPVHDLFDKLTMNVAANDFSNVRCYRVALMDTEGIGIIHRPLSRFLDGSMNDGLASFFSEWDATESEMVSMACLDNVVRREGISRIDMAKIDVEGSELKVLKGSLESLRLMKPKLLLEISDKTARRAGYTARDLYRFLDEIGYLVHRIAYSGGTYVFMTEDDLRPYQNVLCIHKDCV